MRTWEAGLALFLGFWTAFIGILAAPELFPNMRLIVVAVTTITFPLVGLAVYLHNKPEPLPVKVYVRTQSKKVRALQATFIGLMVWEIFALFTTSILFWQTVTIDGLYVVTYYNLFSILLFVGGLYNAGVAVKYFRSSRDEKRNFFFRVN